MEPCQGAAYSSRIAASKTPSFMFGAEGQVDRVRHLVGSALLWDGNPEKDALYLPITPGRIDGATVHELTVKAVPVDGSGRLSSTTPRAIWDRTNTTPIP